MIDPSAVKENQARMEQGRSSYDSAWAEIARLVLPEYQRMFGGGAKTSTWMRQHLEIGGAHDAYAAMALQDGVSVFESYVMPKGQMYQAFEIADDGLMKRVPVLQWLDALAIRLFKLRNDPESGFTASVHESAVSLFAFGPQSLWVDNRYDVLGRWCGLKYEAEFVGDIWIERDGAGNLMRSHRRIELTAEQAQRKWGDNVPPCVAKALDAPTPNRQARFEFIHVIEPNRAYEPGRLDAKGKPWSGAYWSPTDDMLFAQGGYIALPRIVSAFNRPTGSVWGRSPTMTVLPVIRMAQQMELDRAWGAEMRLKPPFLTVDDELDGAVLEIKPHGVTVGGLDYQGNKLVQEFLTQADATDAEKLTMEMRQLIDRVFYRDLLQMNREYKTHIPAARIEEEKAEKGLLLAPLARQEQEWLSPMTQRELALMQAAGLLDDMPGEVADYLDAHGTLGIKYDNGLTMLQEANKSAAFLTLAQQVAVLAPFQPEIATQFEREYPASKVIPELGRISGVPAAMRATEEEQAAFDQQQVAKERMQQLITAAPALAGAAKDAAQAGAASAPTIQ